MARAPSDSALRGRMLRLHTYGNYRIEVIDADGNLHPCPGIEELQALADHGWDHLLEVLSQRYQINRVEFVGDSFPPVESGKWLSAQPLREEGEEPDTLGEEYDTVMQVGEVEQWFRDRRPS